MFSLIITIISIALVAALALATLYYGGDAFKRGASSASAAKLYSQAQQLQGAAELYKADTGAYPLTMEAMLTGNYLRSIPVAQLPGAPAGSGVGVAHAVDVSWAMVAPGEPVFALAPVTYAVCAALNNLAYKTEAVMQSARSTLPMQCFGADEGSLTVVTAKTAQALVASAAVATPGVSLGPVLTAAIPASLTDTTAGTGWLARGAATAVVVPPVVVPPAVLAPQVQLENGAPTAITSLAFSDTSVGSNAPAQTVVLRNTGTANLVLTGAGVTVPAPFSLVSNTCASGTLAPQATCTATVTFSPGLVQAFSGTLEVTSNAATSPALTLSGTGTLPPSPSIGEFGGYKAYVDGSFAQSCAAYRTSSGYTNSGSGIYRVNAGGTPSNVYCDMVNAGGGWTLVMRWTDTSAGITWQQAMIRGQALSGSSNSSATHPVFAGTNNFSELRVDSEGAAWNTWFGTTAQAGLRIPTWAVAPTITSMQDYNLRATLADGTATPVTQAAALPLTGWGGGTAMEFGVWTTAGNTGPCGGANAAGSNKLCVIASTGYGNHHTDNVSLKHVWGR